MDARTVARDCTGGTWRQEPRRQSLGDKQNQEIFLSASASLIFFIF